MKRTKNRPIPRQQLSPEGGFILSYLLIILGVVFLLIFNSSPMPSIIGVLAVIFYNLVYTLLKRLKAFAVFPGALIGAMPPIIGWTFAGGDFFHPQNFVLALFFFLWQVPHFWLLLLVFEEDYKQAGFPVLTEKFTRLQIARISYMWIISMAFCAITIPFLGHATKYFSALILFILALFFLLRLSKVIHVVQPTTFISKRLFN